jgi:PhnB protein
MAMVPQISLMFDGRCAAAFAFYERCLGATIVGTFTYGSSPMAGDAPADWIMHGTLTVGESVIFGNDVAPPKYERPQGFSIVLRVDEPEEAERVFHALAADGTIIWPIQQTFWSVRYGALIDQFGIPWSINCSKAPEGAPS